MEIKKNQIPWIESGYQFFLEKGPDGLNIESLSRSVKKSKSSFYHHFSELDFFIDCLLAYHIQRSKIVLKDILKCKKMNPDILNLFIEVQDDILFNRQLRIHRQDLKYKQCINESHDPIEEALLNFWSISLGLEDQKFFAKMLMNLTVENFYLKITRESFNKEWLLNYLYEIQYMVKSMNR